jgi:hypothetical protein
VKGEITLTDLDFVLPGDLDLDFQGGSCVTSDD